jgi:hypothetical protein
MTAPADPLSRLVFDDADMDRQVLAGLLDGRVRLDLKRGVFGFEHGSRDGMSKRQLVLVTLLAQTALHLLSGQYPAGLKPHEVETLTGIPGNTLRPILKVLAGRNITRRDPSGAHFVAAYGLENASRFLNEEGGEA